MRKVTLLLTVPWLVLACFVGLAQPARAGTGPGLVVVRAGDWLSGNGGAIAGGVPVCAPSSIGNVCDGQPPVVAGVTDKWQCVELAQRLYYRKGWYTQNGGIFTSTPTAASIYANASALGFTRTANGSISDLTPGDMIIHSAAEPGTKGSGHVAIVDTSFNGVVTVREENRSPNGTATYRLANGTLSRTTPSPTAASLILGVVHSPKNQFPASGTYTNSGQALIYSGTFQINWVHSYVYPYSATSVPTWWTSLITYFNTGSQTLSFTCSGWTDPTLAKELIYRAGTYLGYVSASRTYCSDNPTASPTIQPGQSFVSYAVFHNVPQLGDQVAISWSGYGTSPKVSPWVDFIGQ